VTGAGAQPARTTATGTPPSTPHHRRGPVGGRAAAGTGTR
jgi:hypothetical protein